MRRGMRYPAHTRGPVGHPRVGTDALIIGGTAAALGLTTAAILNSNAKTAPASQPVTINNYYISPNQEQNQ